MNRDPFDCLDVPASAPVLLVAVDYDGTLAPIVADPSQAVPEPEAIVALQALTLIPHTHASIISGRALRELRRLSEAPKAVHLVGSHGSEFEAGYVGELPPEALELRRRILAELQALASGVEGAVIEDKPAGAAFHVRNVAEEAAGPLLQRVLEGPGALPGVHVRHGKKVIELAVLETNKGDALDRLRQIAGATTVVYLGDDRTDEDAFARLHGPDMAIKVGEGETQAPFRLGGPADAARFLAALAERRGAWLAGAKAPPIESHAMLTDLRTCALVTPDARVTWLCAPRIDSPALFAELLGGPAAGYFAIRPESDPLRANGPPAPVGQRYSEGSFELHTRWPELEVTDYIDCSDARHLQRAGRSDLVRVVQGKGAALIEFAPRLDFGRVSTRLKVRKGGLEVEDTLDPIVLRAPGVEWTIREEGHHHTAVARVELDRRPVVLELRYGTGTLSRFAAAETERRKQSRRFWTNWSDPLRLPEVAPDLVLRSALVLKGLCYGPTGAIVAAATTSLPAQLGGVRNWDYRYCWLRDAALAAEALVRLGSTAEAMRFLDWVLGVVDACPSPERLRPLYTVNGDELGAEAEIWELPGYAGSRPVRVGNAAAQQIQLDVFGPLVQLVDVLLHHGAPLSAEHWRLIEAIVDAVKARWEEPDHGIWEVRSARRHYVHSKIMCWVAVDRAVSIARQFLDQDREDWRALRERIAACILERGFCRERNAFVAAFDTDWLDAATLQAGLAGLVKPDDPRFAGTVEAIERELREGACVFRYRFDDNLPGHDTGFNLCTSWLIDSYLLLGRVDDARELFEDFTSLAGPTGLVPEQLDPRTGRGLGNHPQAYSHTGIIQNACNLAQVAPRG